MVAPVALQFDVRGLDQTLAGPRQHRPTAVSHAVSAPASLRPSATCSSPARLQPQSLIGCAAFGKL